MKEKFEEQDFWVEILHCRRKKINFKKNVWVVGYPVSWAPCCETWLKFEIEVKITDGNKKK
jgi:hypothetical protein